MSHIMQSVLAGARWRRLPKSTGLYFALQQHKRNVRKSGLALVFPKADGKPYEEGNLLRRLLRPTLAVRATEDRLEGISSPVARALSEMRESGEKHTAGSRILVATSDTGFS